MDKLPILMSEFHEEFEDAGGTESVFLLDDKSSVKIWNSYIDDKATSYFRLPDNNWIITAKRSVLGEWITDFNADMTQRVQTLLTQATGWNDDDRVFLHQEYQGY